MIIVIESSHGVCLFCHFRPPERDSRPLPLGQGLASDSLEIDNHLHLGMYLSARSA